MTIRVEFQKLFLKYMSYRDSFGKHLKICNHLKGMRNVRQNYIEPELKELIQRAAMHYKDPNIFIKNQTVRLGNYSEFKEQYIERFAGLLDDAGTEQIVAISNSGLILGAMTKSLGYDVRILDVHRPSNFQNQERYGDVHWYYMVPEVSSGIRYYSHEPSGIIESKEDVQDGIKMGVIDFDNIEKGVKSTIVDFDVDEGFSMAISNKRVLDLGGNVQNKIVIHNEPGMPGVVALDELL